MSEIAHPFQKRLNKAQLTEQITFWILRFVTYSILLGATYVFYNVLWYGLPMLMEKPVEFLTQAPVTLHVFNVGEEYYELDVNEYYAFKEANPDIEIKGMKTYSYVGGGIFPNIVGTILLVVGSVVIALFLGVLSAIYLSEYAKEGFFMRMVRLAIINLAGVPSIVFGLFGFGVFVLGFGFGQSLIAGWFSLAFMALPVVITASEEAMRTVPQSFREASLAVGATQWQTIYQNVLPYAMPGILTSSILSIARVSGETAPIMFTAAFASADRLPWQEITTWYEPIFRGVMALPYHIYVVAAKIPQDAITAKAQYGTTLVFLVLIILLAMISVVLRGVLRRRYKW